MATGGGEAVLAVRCARYLERDARVQVFASGRRVGAFDVTPGRFRVLRLPVSLPAGPLRLEFASEAPADLAFALDWARIEGAESRLPVRFVAPRLLVAGAFLLALFAGFGLAPSLMVALAVVAGEAAWLALDPFGLAHVVARVTLPALALGCGAAWLLRARPGGRWVVLIFVASYLLKGAAVFHPSYFYNDVRNNRRFAEALRDDPGGLLERAHAAQVRYGVAYPRIVAGRKYAFPYSPLFFWPFGLAGREPADVEEALKHAVAAASAAEAVIVFLLAGLVFGKGGVLAALFAASLPVFYSRLVLALWSTLGGHFFDSLALLFAVAWALQPDSRRRLAFFAACVQASFLTYVASLFNMSVFAGALGLLARRLRFRAWLAGAGAALLTLGLLYFDFTVLFVREILPAYLSAPTVVPAASETLGAALWRIPLFYGWLYPVLAGAGLALARRRADPLVFRVLLAYLLSFAVLVALRGVAGGLFKDMKEVEFVAPLVAVLAGAALEALARRGRSARWLAGAATLALVAFGATSSWAHVHAWTRLAE